MNHLKNECIIILCFSAKTYKIDGFFFRMLAAGTSGNGGARESNDDDGGDDPEAASPFLISVGIGDGIGKVGLLVH